MLVKRSKDHKKYLLLLKKDINDFIENFKKRYQLFPWSEVNKLKKIQLNSNVPITVNGVSFTVLELVKEINKIKVKIQNQLKGSYYNFILRAYTKDAMNKTGADLTSIYNSYKDQLDQSFKQTKEDLLFCISALKEINKLLKKDNKIVSESTNPKSIFFDDFKKYIKDNNLDKVRPLGNIKTHEVKNKKETWWLLATSDSDENGSYKTFCDKLTKNVKYDGNEIEFHSCYLPGDVFIFVKEPKLIKESEEEEMRDTFLNSNYESVDLNDFLLECAREVISDDIEDGADVVVSEGVNLDVRAIFKENKKNYKTKMKNIKTNLKENKFDDAIKEAEGLLDDIKEMKKQVSKFDSTVGSTVISYFTAWTLTFLRTLALCLIPVYGSIISSIWNLIEEFKKPVVKIVKGEPLSVDDFNVYKNQAESRMDQMEKTVKNLITKMKEQKSEYEKEQKEKDKKDKEVKESAEFRAAKLDLYEACNRGEITVEEREELFADLQDKLFIKESADIEDNSASKYEKYNKVKEVLYERCTNGEINVEEREQLLSKAHDMIFTESDDDSEMKEDEVNKNVESAIKDGGKDLEKNLDKVIK